MRAAFIPVRPDWKTASARLRVFLPIRCLRAAGIAAEVFEPSREDEYDVVVFSKIYGAEERELALRLRARGATALLDLCDNHFHAPNGSARLEARARKLRRMLEVVDGVTVSTGALAEVVAEERPGVPVQVVDDAFDPMIPSLAGRLRLKLLKKLRRRLRVHGRGLRVVWFGHQGEAEPPFGLVDLVPLLPALAEVHARAPLSLTVITGSRERFEELIARNASFPARFVAWRRDTFRHVFAQHDVCVIPITENPFTRCKTANRVLLALHAGVPVIADPIPSYEPLAPYVRFRRFVENLTELARDPTPFQLATRAGRACVEREWTPQRTARQWSDALHAALASR